MILYLWMITQIIGENLPISSSGHVQLVLSYFDVAMPINVMKDFDYFLQSMRVLVFLCYFFASWWHLILGQKIAMQPLFDAHVWKNKILPCLMFGLVADGATVVFWYVDIASKISLPLAAGFAITGFILYSMHYAQEKKDIALWSLRNGLIVGTMQGFALLPGVSRFATTMATLQWLGYQRMNAFYISFLLQWPLIILGSIKGLLSLHDSMIMQTITTMPFIISMIFAAVISYGMISWIGKIIKKNALWKFSYYMIIPTSIALLHYVG